MGRVSSAKSFAHKLLKVLAVSGAVAIAATSPYFGLNLIRGIEKELRRRKWRQFYNTLHQLKKQKRIDIFQNNDGSYKVTLTSLGNNIVCRYDLDNLTIPRPEKWDGQWRFFSFDIPAYKKEARFALLSKLKELGFVLVQRSLWAYPFECQKELMIIARAFGVESHVLYLSTHYTSGEAWIKKRFNQKSSFTLI